MKWNRVLRRINVTVLCVGMLMTGTIQAQAAEETASDRSGAEPVQGASDQTAAETIWIQAMEKTQGAAAEETASGRSWAETVQGASDQAAEAVQTQTAEKAQEGAAEEAASGVSGTETAQGASGQSAEEAAQAAAAQAAAQAAAAQTAAAQAAEAARIQSDARRQYIVEYAKQFLGCRYRYGGNDPHTGVDCSGFVRYVMQNAAGVAMQRSSTAQAAQGRTISADQMRPGDLIFYGSGSRVNHVAIYAGNGQIIHASTYKTGVKLSVWNYRAPIRIANVLGD